MQLKLTARHDNPSDATRQYAEAKLSKLDRRLHDLTLVEVTFSRERNPSIADDHIVDAVVHTKGPNLVARESAPTYEAAIDRLLDKLERQVERYRDKRTVENAAAVAERAAGASRRPDRAAARRDRGVSPAAPPGRPCAAGAAVSQPGEHGRAADQAEVAVRLRVVAEAAFGERVVLLGEQPGRPGRLEHLLEQLLGVAAPAGAQVRLDQPRRADVEAALGAGQPVVPPVAVDDRRRCAAPPRPSAPWRGSADRRRARARTARSRATTRRSPRRRRRRSRRRRRRSSRARARSSRIRSRNSTQSARSGSPRSACTCERPVDGEPAHHLRVDVVAGRQPGLPDAVVRLVPAPLDGLHHRLDDPPVLVAHRAAGLDDRCEQIGDRARRRRAGSAGWRRCRRGRAGTRRTRAACR